jgi:hypothetical protein
MDELIEAVQNLNLQLKLKIKKEHGSFKWLNASPMILLQMKLKKKW